MRSIVGVTVRVTVLLLAIRTFFVAPIVVPTGSMAPAILGVHGDAACPKCGRAIQWGADLMPFDVAKVRCFSCGAEQTEYSKRALLGGDRLLVDRNAFWLRSPRRWELAVVHDPEAPHQWLVKRVVGVPGDTLSIRDGDLFNGDARLKKSLEQFRAVAVPIYCASDETDANASSAWHGLTDVSTWERHRRGGDVRFLHLPMAQALTPEKSPQSDWLVYDSPAAMVLDHSSMGSVLDALPYNQDTLRRPFAMSDVMVSCRVRWQGDGAIAVRMPTREDVVIRIAPLAGQAEVFIGGASRLRKPWPAPREGTAFSLTVAHCDHRVLLEIDGRSFACDLDVPGSPSTSPGGQLAIGIQSIGVELIDLRVGRDVYYSPPAELSAAPWDQVHLGAGEYLLLGDNPACSRDSRYWQPAAVNHKSFLGKPFLVHGASRTWRVAGWTFQVPDFERIRYIPTARDE